MKQNHLLRNSIIFTIIVIVIEYLLYQFSDRWIAQTMATVKSGHIFMIASVASAYLSQFFWSTFLSIGLVIAAIKLNHHRDSLWAKKVLFVVLSVTCTMLIGFTLRFMLGRYHPLMLVQHNVFGFQFFGRTWDVSSMPSFYNYYIFALMFSLAALFRRYGIVFTFFAVIVGFSRILLSMHFISDVILGAYLGVLVSVWTHQLMFGHTNFDPWLYKALGKPQPE